MMIAFKRFQNGIQLVDEDGTVFDVIDVMSFKELYEKFKNFIFKQSQNHFVIFNFDKVSIESLFDFLLKHKQNNVVSSSKICRYITWDGQFSNSLDGVITGLQYVIYKSSIKLTYIIVTLSEKVNVPVKHICNMQELEVPVVTRNVVMHRVNLMNKKKHKSYMILRTAF